MNKEDIEKYFRETPDEVIKQQWEKFKSFDGVGPTVDEYLNVIIKQKKKMIKDRVTLKTAKLAKQTGFDFECDYYFNDKDELVEYTKFIEGIRGDVFVSHNLLKHNFNDDNITVNEDDGTISLSENSIYTKQHLHQD